MNPAYGRSGITAASAAISRPERIAKEITRRLASAQAALNAALARKSELKDFAAWGNVEALDAWLRGIRELQDAGDLAGAYDRAFSIATLAQTRQAEHLAEAVPFMVLGPIGGARFTIRDGHRSLPAPAALDEAFLGEFEFPEAPTAINYVLPEGGRRIYRLARTVNPYQAQRDLAAHAPPPCLRRAWLIGGGWDFEQTADTPDKENWGVYYAWSEIHAPETRSMGMELDTDAPCLYLWLDGMLSIVDRCPEKPESPRRLSQRRGGLRFKEGLNRIFLKILMRPGDKFHLRLFHYPSPRGRVNYMHDLRYSFPESNTD